MVRIVSLLAAWVALVGIGVLGCQRQAERAQEVPIASEVSEESVAAVGEEPVLTGGASAPAAPEPAEFPAAVPSPAEEMANVAAPSAEEPVVAGPSAPPSVADAPMPQVELPSADNAPSTVAAIPVESSKPTQPPAEHRQVIGLEHGAEEVPDPVQVNGRIFVDWPKPAATVVLSGLQQGYIEPCGCAGLTNQKGGLARKHTFLKELEAKGWNPVALDVGELVKRYGKQQEVKYQAMIDAMKTMGYDAIAFGPSDLRLPGEFMLATVAPTGDQESPFVAANVVVFDESFIPKYKIVEAGGKRIAVTAILGKEYQSKVSSEGIEFQDAAASLKAVLPQMLAAKPDLMVLLANATTKESQELAQQVPRFDFVVTAEGADEPPATPKEIPGTKTKLLEVGHKGMYLAVLGLYGNGEVRYQRVPLDHRFEDAQEMKEVMATYQEQLQQLGLEGLGLRPMKHPSGRQFVGSETCGDCHTKAYEHWSHTPHAHATETLTKLEVPRHFDPECLSCHTTGWEPQKYFPFESGYLGLEKTPLMVGNGCENCHGPGSAHVAAESGDVAVDDAGIAQLRKEMHAEKSADACMQCHDLDNSPEFVKEGGFEKYWPVIEHYGKD